MALTKASPTGGEGVHDGVDGVGDRVAHVLEELDDGVVDVRAGQAHGVGAHHGAGVAQPAADLLGRPLVDLAVGLEDHRLHDGATLGAREQRDRLHDTATLALFAVALDQRTAVGVVQPRDDLEQLAVVLVRLQRGGVATGQGDRAVGAAVVGLEEGRRGLDRTEVGPLQLPAQRGEVLDGDVGRRGSDAVGHGMSPASVGSLLLRSDAGAPVIPAPSPTGCGSATSERRETAFHGGRSAIGRVVWRWTQPGAAGARWWDAGRRRAVVGPAGR